MSLFREKVGFYRGVSRPVVDQATGIKCLTCLKPVDEELMQGPMMGDGKDYSVILVRCHGAEQEVRLDMGTIYWDRDDFNKQKRGQECFNPHHVGGVPETDG